MTRTDEMYHEQNDLLWREQMSSMGCSSEEMNQIEHDLESAKLQMVEEEENRYALQNFKNEVDKDKL